jgi:hypothetical protein
MAGSTPNQLPYPTGTDRVMDGDNAMQALAESIRVWGTSVLLNLATTPTANVVITFPAGLFTAVPNVACMMHSSAWNAGSSGAPTTTSVTMNARALSGSAGSGTLTCQVIAAQFGP